MNIAINGFGRIGRQAFKAGFGRKNFSIVAINDLTDTKALAYLLKYDTSYGRYSKSVSYDEKNIIVDGKKIPVFAQRDPLLLPWKKLKIDVVLECTGFFRTKETAELHLKAGAKKVIISAPPKGDLPIPMYIRGVNCGKLNNEKSKIISKASCTTTCVAPITAVLLENFGIERALLTTVHSATTSQSLQDGPNKDYREGRAFANNIIPTATGAAKAVGKVIPEMDGIFDGLSVRVPTLTGSLSDVTYILKKNVTVEEINNCFIKASKTKRFKGIIEVTTDPIVSSDIVGNTHSAIVDLSLTKVMSGNMVKVVAWYDNEWGYAHRLVEMAELFV